MSLRPTTTRRRRHLLFGMILPLIVLAANLRPVWSLTIDDAYISFRYARNFARGLGLVYNLGERVEGYTNFLWTVLIGGAIRLGLDPIVTAKIIGALAALGSVVVMYHLSTRLRPLGALPPLCTWLMASSIVQTAYAVFGLETSLFTFLLLAGWALILRELDDLRRFPISGVVLALAALTRPEAPIYVALLLAFCGSRARSRQNLWRCVLFMAPIAAHLLWRHAYYGAWLPNTFFARNRDLIHPVARGLGYVASYSRSAPAVAGLALIGVFVAAGRRARWALAAATIVLVLCLYVIAVGGDWMPAWRFLAPVEPFLFLLADLAARTLAEERGAAVRIALAALVLTLLVGRTRLLRGGQRELVLRFEARWDETAGAVARTLLASEHAGPVSLGDIGYVGWATDRPIFDHEGLIDPEVGRLQLSRPLDAAILRARFRGRRPAFLVIVSKREDCSEPSFPPGRALFADPSLRAEFRLTRRLPTVPPFSWCLYERRAGGP